MELTYEFERMSDGDYQVRLLGEFVCYTSSKDEESVGTFLSANGYTSKRDFLNSRTRDWFD